MPVLAWIRRLARGCDKPDVRESEAALKRARTARQEAEDRRPAVDAAVAPIRRARQENHLRERIELAFAERRGARP
jgi:hypothetical protein